MLDLNKKPKRLLHAFSSFEVGGVQRRFAQIVNNLSEDFHHLIFAMDDCYDGMMLIEPHVSFEVIDQGHPEKNTFSNVKNFHQTLKTIKPHRLITYNWGAIEWAMANFISAYPHIHIEDGFGREEANRRLRRRQWTRRLVLCRHSQVVLPSKNLFAIARDEWKIAASHTQYIPNGIDAVRFAMPLSKSFLVERGVPADKTLIGTVAGMRREKNIGRMLEAFAALDCRSSCHLVIVGDGALLSELKDVAKSMNMASEVTFLGALTAPEQALAGFDIFALSSDTEQMPLSILEAMASGLPIAGVDVGDVIDMVAQENRMYIVEPSAQSLTEVMERLVGESESRRIVGDANRAKVVEEFSLMKMLASYEALFV